MSVENQIESQYVEGFKANMNMSPQQTTSRLLGSVDSDLNYAEPGTMFNVDWTGTSDPEDVQTRVADTPDKFIGESRRCAPFTEFHDSCWFDNVDQTRVMADPTSSKMSALMAGRWRKADDKIISVAFADALEKVDQDSFTTVSFPAAQIVAVNTTNYTHQDESIPGGGADYGMSIGKLIEAGVILDAAELEDINGPLERFLAFSAKQKGDLLRTTPVTSRYYNEVQALNDGKLTSFMGFTLKRSERLQKTGNNRKCIAWVKPALAYRGRTITNARISIRTDKSDTPQAFYKTAHAAVRTLDVGVVQILCKEG